MLSIANDRPCQKVEKSAILNSNGAALLHKYTKAVVKIKSSQSTTLSEIH
jgi:hypothetical protein